ncbi:hypothetical protein CR513_01152, partial [Mucuna pruriens]
MHSINILIVNHFKHGRKYPSLCLKVTTRPNRDPNIQSLRRWGEQLKGQWRRAFEKKYGNLLVPVNIEVQPAALSVLTQYYDPPLRCFTFCGFQLAPTLEEYERMIEYPMINLHPTSLGGITPLGLRWPDYSRNIKAEEKSEQSGRDPRSGLGRETSTASRGRRLTDLCGRVWTLGLWHNALSSNRTLCRFGRHRFLSRETRPGRTPYGGSLGQHLLYFGLL